MHVNVAKPIGQKGVLFFLTAAFPEGKQNYLIRRVAQDICCPYNLTSYK